MDGFVGRPAELRLLAAALERARHGAGRLVTVSGPGGVGKTRFCEEVTRRARAGATVEAVTASQRRRGYRGGWWLSAVTFP